MAFEFQSGTEGAKSVQKDAGGGGFGRALGYFKLDDGDHLFLRFLTDYKPTTDDEGNFIHGTISVLEHPMVTTGKPPKDWGEGKFPGVMTSVCRLTKVNKGGELVPAFDDCWVCENVTDKEGKPWKQGARTYGLAVLREEIRKDGKRVGFKDKTVEVPKRDENGKIIEGQTEERPAYIQIAQGYKNFWSGFVGSYDMYDTLLDRDYRISRSGSGAQDTEYSVAAADPAGVKNDDGEVVKLDLREAWARKRFYGDAPDLGEIVEEKMSDKFASRFFNGGVPIKGEDGESTAPSSNDTDEDALKAMAERIRPLGGDKAEEEQDSSDSETLLVG